MINLLVLNIVLAIAWAALMGSFTLASLGVGFVIGSIFIYLTGALYPGTGRYFSRSVKWAKLVLLFLYELVVSSIDVAREVLTTQNKARPGIISIPLTVRDETDIFLLTNMISLTPGTLSLDVTEDRETLYIHAMFADDPDSIRTQIREGMERWVIEATE